MSIKTKKGVEKMMENIENANKELEWIYGEDLNGSDDFLNDLATNLKRISILARINSDETLTGKYLYPDSKKRIIDSEVNQWIRSIKNER